MLARTALLAAAVVGTVAGAAATATPAQAHYYPYGYGYRPFYGPRYAYRPYYYPRYAYRPFVVVRPPVYYRPAPPVVVAPYGYYVR